MTLFPTVVALWDARVHVGTSDGGNVMFVVKRIVNKKFCLGPVLRVSYIYPYNGHVGLRRGFDYPWF